MNWKRIALVSLVVTSLAFTGYAAPPAHPCCKSTQSCAAASCCKDAAACKEKCKGKSCCSGESSKGCKLAHPSK